MTTDTSEKGLESLIVKAMTGREFPDPVADDTLDRPTPSYGGWLLGDAKQYDRDYCVDLRQLSFFLFDTQAELAKALDLKNDGPTRRAFLARIEKEIAKRGVIDVLRKGVKHGAHDITLFYGTPSAGNPKAAELFAKNRFSVTRQLRYSNDETRRALDLGLFINGLPIATLS